MPCRHAGGGTDSDTKQLLEVLNNAAELNPSDLVRSELPSNFSFAPYEPASAYCATVLRAWPHRRRWLSRSPKEQRRDLQIQAREDWRACWPPESDQAMHDRELPHIAPLEPPAFIVQLIETDPIAVARRHHAADGRLRCSASLARQRLRTPRP